MTLQQASREAIPLRIGIVAGTTRPGRKSLAVAQWLHTLSADRQGATYEVIDIAGFDLPLFDEPFPPASGRREHPHSLRWAAAVDALDAFVMVTAEYNHGPSAALKNAIDYLQREWADKAVAFASYGADGGVRAVEQLRQIAGELRLADVRQTVSLSLTADFEHYTHFIPREDRAPAASAMFEDLERWARALRSLRT